MEKINVLLEEIEDLRKRLQDLLNRKHVLNAELIDASQALDKKLNEYDELMEQEDKEG